PPRQDPPAGIWDAASEVQRRSIRGPCGRDRSPCSRPRKGSSQTPSSPGWSRPRNCRVVVYQERRNSTMSGSATPAPPLVVDVAVVLTAVVRPEPDAGGYSASIPALPGCHTQGETLGEVRANLREAAEGWLSVAHEDGLAREAAGGAS